ncbi:MAG: glycosyltransferase [Solirubrobacterales bacterium]|nr:glycosyltransferase [Solirubrobacterales bacterium]
MDLSYCVVNTNGRGYLRGCLNAIRAGTPAGLDTELLVLDNSSEDGSVEEIEAWNAGADGVGAALRLFALERREGKATCDSLLLREASGELCLLLNEDTELRAGAVEALVAALRGEPEAVAAGANLLDPDGVPQPSAWRLPGLATSLAGALFMHRLLVTESRGRRIREVGWVQSAAMLVRRQAVAAVGYLDPEFFVYSDETDLCKRLHDAGGRILWVPAAHAIHHEQLATDRAAGAARVVEFHRGRDRYLRKHHSTAVALLARALGAWAYAARALAASVLPGHDAAWYWLHARQALRPDRGAGLREAAAAYNRARAR